ncbi:general secretion pathway protein D [Crenobacter luteus]|nr:general secretion pathway protein D [Crenobacter luteus]
MFDQGEFPHVRQRTMHTLAIGLLAFLCLLLSGCAAQMAYREGKQLVAKGRVEEGIAKFQEALSHEPRKPEYKAAYIQTRETAVRNYLEQADRELSAGRVESAETLYKRTLAIDASNARALAGLRAIDVGQRHTRLVSEAETALRKKDIDGAQFKLNTVLSEAPAHPGALALQRQIAERKQRLLPESGLSAAYKRPISIEFRDVPIKQIFEVLSRSSGLNFIFDKDVKTDQRTTVYLKNSTIESVVYFVLLTNQLEQQVLNPNTILIYPNNENKSKVYQDMTVRSFFLTNADARIVANTLKTIVKARDVVVDEKLNMLIMRDSPDAIRLASKLVALHDAPEPEVMLEVEILEIKRSRLLELGIDWPDSISLSPLASSAGGALTLRDLRNLNSGGIGASVGPVTVNARKFDTDAKILANPRIRARNREKAKILIGERVPNITTTSTATGFASESINYIDVGLKLDVEPMVRLDDDVEIKIALEVSNIVGQLQTKAGTVAYQIGTRNASTVLRMRNGENQVLAGLINNEDRRNANKIPGLGELPLLGRLFGSTADDSQKTEIVLSITPHLIRNIERPESSLSEFQSGTESSLRLRPDGAMTADETPASPPPSTPLPAPAAEQASDVRLSWEGADKLAVGERFTLQLRMESAQPVTSLPLAISYDPKVLQASGVAEGDFLAKGGAATRFTSKVDPGGQILITGTRQGDGGATGSGNIASVSFRALAPTESTSVSLLTIAPVGVGGRSLAPQNPGPHQLRIGHSQGQSGAEDEEAPSER